MVSIIIVNFNTKDLTLACLTSIYKFSPKEEFEVIVIDNGSSDGSLEKLRENRNITLIEADKNLCFAKGNNLGIKFDLDSFSVARSCVYALIRRALRLPSSVPWHHRHNASEPLKDRFGAPKTAPTKNRDFFFIIHNLGQNNNALY